jgi:phage virion morphogenesis protein
MTAFVQVKIDDRDVMHRLYEVAARGHNLTPVMKAFGDYLVKETVDRFEKEQEPSGKAWRPLSPETLKYKKNDLILTEKSFLRNSIHRQAGPLHVRVGSNRAYAAAHQFGIKEKLNIRSHRRKVKTRNKRGIQAGVTFVKAHDRDVNLPPRPFLGFRAYRDRKELINTLKDYLKLDR